MGTEIVETQFTLYPFHYMFDIATELFLLLDKEELELFRGHDRSCVL